MTFRIWQLLQKMDVLQRKQIISESIFLPSFPKNDHNFAKISPIFYLFY